jgi:SAM-dependent methyltransferase
MGQLLHVFKSITASLYWFATQRRWRMRDIFNDVYEGQTQSETFRNILREVFGDEYAAEADPCGFLSMTDLHNIVQHVGIGKGQTLVDLACGRGGAGLWVARELGVRLTGIDISAVAVEEARRRVAAFGLEGRAQFQVADFAATRLATTSFDAAMSIDALYLVADKTGSINEVARILRPGARFVFTTWDVDLPLMITDHRPILANAGFEVECYEVTSDWERRQRGVHERVLANRDALIREMGEASAKFWIVGAQTELPRLAKMRRVFIVARKTK